MGYLAPVIALGITLIAGMLLFAFLDVSAFSALHAFFVEPVSSLYGLAELGVKAAPLIMMGVALSIGFRAQVWNIGAEGQLTLGAIAGAGVALALYEVDAWYVLPLMTFAGIAGGMAWAMIPAFLKTRFNVNEILTSLMLSYVAVLLLAWLVAGPMRDPDGFNFPESRLFHEAALLPKIVDGTRLHIGALVSLGVVIAGWFLLFKTLLGFALRVNGSAPRAGGYAGFDQTRLVWIAMLLGGASAGLAGLFEVAGPIGQLVPSISPGYGFTAIIVAFLGRLHPVGVLFAGLIIALSYLGGESAQITLNLPLAVTGVFQGMLLFFLLATDVLIHYSVRWSGRHQGEMQKNMPVSGAHHE
ncbi:MAG: ABC transporter permease [Granulosicoccus sp.]|nr:ABC transporter permease [Granulosicoccus sp.]